VSPHGFWLFVGEQELFVSFREFPWFKDASIREISRVELPSAHHLYWPDLDIDLARLRLGPTSMWLRLARGSISCPHSVRASLSKAA